MKLTQEQQEVIRKFLTARWKHLECIQIVLAQWEQIREAANDKRKHFRTDYANNKRIWDFVEKSVPVFLSETQHNECVSSSWLVSVYFLRRSKEFYLDVRQYRVTDTGNWEPTSNGIRLSIPNWLRLLQPIYKLIHKHKGTHNDQKTSTSMGK